jgi:Na+-translocating ferredoxin:NAD+ oxidoreductase subunit G
MKNKYLHLTLVLFIIAALSGLAISSLNIATRDKIAKNLEEKVEKGIKEVYPEGTSFQDVTEIDSYSFKSDATYLDLYEVKNGDELIGYVFTIVAPDSFSAGNLHALVGVNLDGTIQGVAYAKFQETTGIGDKVLEPEYSDLFIGLEDPSTLDTISGATFTSSSVIAAVELAQDYFLENLNK